MGKKEDKKEAIEKLEEKIEEKVEVAESKGADPQKIQNVIGDITPPQDPENKEEVRSYLKSIDQGIKELLNLARPKPEPEEKAPVPPPKKLDHFGYEIEKDWMA